MGIVLGCLWDDLSMFFFIFYGCFLKMFSGCFGDVFGMFLGCIRDVFFCNSLGDSV